MSISDSDDEIDPLDDLPSLQDSSVEVIDPVVIAPQEQDVSHFYIFVGELIQLIIGLSTFATHPRGFAPPSPSGASVDV